MDCTLNITNYVLYTKYYKLWAVTLNNIKCRLNTKQHKPWPGDWPPVTQTDRQTGATVRKEVFSMLSPPSPGFLLAS